MLISCICYVTLLIVGNVLSSMEEVRWSISVNDEERTVTHDKHSRIKRNNLVVGTFTISRDFKDAVVRAHNNARNEVSPTAANMREMSWDDQLERLATEYSKQCLFAHNRGRSDSRFPHVGENIFLSTFRPFNPAYGTLAVVDWDREKEFYTFANSSCVDREMCGHYTQVVWSSSYKVGCGATKCARVTVGGQVRMNPTILICNYGPSGNVVGRKPFDQGRSCSNCGSSDRCENNLCVNAVRSATFVTNTATWNQWGRYEPCSRTGGGSAFRSRFRTCSTGVVDDCIGAQESRLGGCGPYFWSSWLPWGRCSTSCGSGRRIRTRTCVNGNDDDCSGATRERETCNTTPCAGEFSNWTPWSRCSVVACGGGIRRRTRSCLQGSTCIGDRISTETCNTAPCTLSEWGPWNNWGECSRSCGGGRRMRSRVCSPGNSGPTCDGSSSRSNRCNRQECPTLSQWSPWSSCSVTCGNGTISRTRECSSSRTLDCTSEIGESFTCINTGCPASERGPRSWGPWGTWTACLVTCEGGGKQSRSRSCRQGITGPGCTGQTTEEQNCEINKEEQSQFACPDAPGPTDVVGGKRDETTPKSGGCRRSRSGLASLLAFLLLLIIML